MTRVFWDTNLFVYLLEGGAFASKVRALRARMLDRGDQLVISALTLGELLVKPRAESEAAARDHETVLRRVALVVPFDAECAGRYAAIRADRTIKAPDAIQLACAVVAGVDLFITNDGRLSRKHIPGVKFITAFDRAFL